MIRLETEFMPKSENPKIAMLNTKESQDKFFENVPAQGIAVLKSNCEKRFPEDLIFVKNNFEKIYNAVKEFYLEHN